MEEVWRNTYENTQMKNHFLFVNVLKLFQMEDIWSKTWEHTQLKNHFLAISVLRTFQKEDIWKHTQEKKHFFAINVLRLSQKIVVWRKTGEQTQVKKTFPCKKCPKAFSQGGQLKIHFTKHSGEKPYSSVNVKVTFQTIKFLAFLDKPTHLQTKMECLIIFVVYLGFLYKYILTPTEKTLWHWLKGMVSHLSEKICVSLDLH